MRSIYFLTHKYKSEVQKELWCLLLNELPMVEFSHQSAQPKPPPLSSLHRANFP